MKNKFFLLVLTMSLLQTNSFAQRDFLKEPEINKPLLFADMPSLLTVPELELEKAMGLSPGAAVTISTDQSILFNGIVSSVTRHDTKLLTVIIKLTGREGSNLTISAIRADQGVITYTAKLLSFQHGDCFILQRNDGRSYSFVKKKFYEVVGE